MFNECGADGEMRIDRGNRNTPKKTAPVSLCPPQIPHNLTELNQDCREGSL
jgi:hypothetical protein